MKIRRYLCLFLFAVVLLLLCHASQSQKQANAASANAKSKLGEKVDAKERLSSETPQKQRVKRRRLTREQNELRSEGEARLKGRATPSRKVPPKPKQAPSDPEKFARVKQHAEKVVQEVRGMRAKDARRHIQREMPGLKLQKVRKDTIGTDKMQFEDPTVEDLIAAGLEDPEARVEGKENEKQVTGHNNEVFEEMKDDSEHIYEKDSFIEELKIHNLKPKAVYSHFQFTTKSAVKESDGGIKSSEIFPRVLNDIIWKYSIAEMSLSFTQGTWNYEKWGFPVVGSPTGVELYVWFFEEDSEGKTVDVDENWKLLVNTLSGLFCASLNFIDSSMTAVPRYSIYPQSHLFSRFASSKWSVRYGILARENVCTENLTPWKKLLPCRSKGLVKLLNPLKIYDSLFNSMAIKTSFSCPDESCSEPQLQLLQTISMVSKPEIFKVHNDTKVVSLLNNHKNGVKWSFKSLYGSSLRLQCPLSSRSNIFFDVTDEYSEKMNPRPPQYVSFDKATASSKIESLRDLFPLQERQFEDERVYDALRSSVKLFANQRFDGMRQFGAYDAKKFDELDLSYYSVKEEPDYDHIYNEVDKINYRSGRASVFVRKFLLGYGQEYGGIGIRIFNDCKESFEAVLFDVLPWQFRPYMHTLRQVITHSDGTSKAISLDSCHLTPSVDRIRSSSIECFLTLPPESVVTVEYDIKKLFLRYTEYPPDANHGFHVGSAALAISLPSSFSSSAGLNWSPYNAVTDSISETAMSRLTSSMFENMPSSKRKSGYGYNNVLIYSNSILIRPPIPDFSMPYNVITLTCTVLALIFGNVFNNITRTFAAYPVKVDDRTTRRKKIMRVVIVLVTILGLGYLYAVENEIIEPLHSGFGEEARNH